MARRRQGEVHRRWRPDFGGRHHGRLRVGAADHGGVSTCEERGLVVT